MDIRNHLLYETDGAAVPFIASPNHGGELNPRYLLLHYTTTPTLQQAVSWFLNPEARASAHILVDRGGATIQMVPLDRCAWHAGRSRWGSLEDLNLYSIGIELVNAGALT